MTGKGALAVVLLVALAGCNGALGPLGGDGGDQPSRPPGVTEDGVNATRLLDAHAAALANQSFTVETSATAPWAGWNRSVRVSTNDTAAVSTAD